ALPIYIWKIQPDLPLPVPSSPHQYPVPQQSPLPSAAFPEPGQAEQFLISLFLLQLTVLIQLCLLTVLISFYFASFNNFPSLLALTSFECYSISHILVNRVQISNFAFWSISRYYLYFSLLYFIFLFFSHLFIFLSFPKRNENENIKIPLPGISPRKRYFSPYRLQRFFSCLSVFIGLDFFQLIENHIVEYFDVG